MVFGSLLTEQNVIFFYFFSTKSNPVPAMENVPETESVILRPENAVAGQDSSERLAKVTYLIVRSKFLIKNPEAIL